MANVVGSAVLGALTGASGVSAAMLALVGTGFSGALTTFSTFGADVVRLVSLRGLRRWPTWAPAWCSVSVLR